LPHGKGVHTAKRADKRIWSGRAEPQTRASGRPLSSLTPRAATSPARTQAAHRRLPRRRCRCCYSPAPPPPPPLLLLPRPLPRCRRRYSPRSPGLTRHCCSPAGRRCCSPARHHPSEPPPPHSPPPEPPPPPHPRSGVIRRGTVVQLDEYVVNVVGGRRFDSASSLAVDRLFAFAVRAVSARVSCSRG
jgi:hypothetical protein